MKKILLTIIALCCMTATAMAQSTTVTNRQRDIVAIASQTAKGNLDDLKISLAKSLDDGMTVNEVKEVIVHSYAYSGFPRALRGLQMLVEVLDERKAQGISDNWGKEASPIKSKKSKYERGRDILAEISGAPKDAPKPAYAQLSPEIEVFLKEHLFCDLFERDVLTYKERELATVAVINSLGRGVEPMLKSHVGLAMKTGTSADEIRELFGINTESLLTPHSSLHTKKVSFHNRFNIDIAADMYFPDDYDPAKKYAAILPNRRNCS